MIKNAKKRINYSELLHKQHKNLQNLHGYDIIRRDEWDEIL